MNIEATLREIVKKQERIDSKLTALLNKKEKQTWVKVSFILDLTGWTAEKLRQARDAGIIKYTDSKERGREYLLESLPEAFFKKHYEQQV